MTQNLTTRIWWDKRNGENVLMIGNKTAADVGGSIPGPRCSYMRDCQVDRFLQLLSGKGEPKGRNWKDGRS